jgi:hypothetical protein
MKNLSHFFIFTISPPPPFQPHFHHFLHLKLHFPPCQGELNQNKLRFRDPRAITVVPSKVSCSEAIISEYICIHMYVCICV